MTEVLEIAYRPVADLVPYARNARTHSAEQVAQIVASVREFGWTNPVLVDGAGGIIAGHGRVLAALEMGLLEVPCIELAHLTELQRRAYVLADNQLALNSGWDKDLLRFELAHLTELGTDLGLIGFGADELAGIFADRNNGLTDPDDVPEVQAVIVSRPGDAWVLGSHRLVCGDSTTVEAVDAALAGAKPHLMVTDPPYGVEYDPAWRNARSRSCAGMGNRGLGAGAIGKVMNDDRADWSDAWALFPGDVAYVWCASLHIHEVADSLLASGFDLRSQIIWAKSNFAIGRGHYHWQHEPCWYAVRKNATGQWHGDRKQTTLWQIPKPAKSETGHGTQKPVECMARPIENNSKPGDAVYEPFSGSGTTIIAAEMSGRACHAIELSPQYVDVAVRRWQAFAGGVAILDGDGRSFEQLAAERAKVPDARTSEEAITPKTRDRKSRKAPRQQERAEA